MKGFEVELLLDLMRECRELTRDARPAASSSASGIPPTLVQIDAMRGRFSSVTWK